MAALSRRADAAVDASRDDLLGLDADGPFDAGVALRAEALDTRGTAQASAHEAGLTGDAVRARLAVKPGATAAAEHEGDDKDDGREATRFHHLRCSVM